MRPRAYFVYIAANEYRTVLYTGVTNSMGRRMREHKSGEGSEFTSEYKVTDLLHVEEFREVRNAIRREKQIKAWSRAKKMSLIRLSNPGMVDLSSSLPWMEA